jgi:hypothetical protein
LAPAQAGLNAVADARLLQTGGHLQPGSFGGGQQLRHAGILETVLTPPAGDKTGDAGLTPPPVLQNQRKWNNSQRPRRS